jgi:membrane protein YqaA with SNARE-associated domain
MSEHETSAPEARAVAPRTRRPSAVRRLYDWTVHWAGTKHALPALFVLSFAESSFFPVPPDVLLMAMCFARPRRWPVYAFWCTVASVLGGIAGYGIGWGFWELAGRPIVDFYDGHAVMERIRGWYDEFGVIGILLAAITPIPYKVFTIASGLFEFSFWSFAGASAVGRGFRFFVVAGLIGYLGDRIRPFVERRLELLLVAFAVLLVGGFALIRMLH